jgi:16S rRNA (uracil1498-N3)-methyltransferase
LTDRSLESPSSWRLDTFFVPPGALGSRAVALDGAEAHHAVHVVRAVPGNIVRLIDGEGVEAIGRIDRVDASKAWLSVVEVRAHDRGEGVELVLVQGLLKGRAFSEVVRRATELGVAGVVPVVTERTVGRVREGTEAERVARWRAVALAALKQCRGVYLPEVEPPRALAEIAPLLAGADLALVAWEEERSATLKERLSGLTRPGRVILVVGPEGGLSPGEVGFLRGAGAVSVSVGRRVLRADWAGPAVAAMIGSELGGLLP